jgi:hypothetical protein
MIRFRYQPEAFAELSRGARYLAYFALSAFAAAPPFPREVPGQRPRSLNQRQRRRDARRQNREVRD